MEIVIVSAVVAAVTSMITTKILATHYFEIVDGYVSDMYSMIKEFVDTITHKIEQINRGV